MEMYVPSAVMEVRHVPPTSATGIALSFSPQPGA
jgi:hypothetical protein